MSARTSVGETPSIVTLSLGDDLPHAVVGAVRRTLHEHDRRAAGHGADHGPRTHDPAHVGREEDAIAGAEIRLVRGLARDREEEAGLDVQRSLRLARRAGRVGKEVRRLALDGDCLELSQAVPPTASSHHESRPVVIGQSTPARLQTSTRSTLGASASASSSTAFIGTTFPRRYDASAVRTSFAPASASRDDTAGPANPEKIGTCTAPMCAHACDAIAASGAIGRNVPTTSPSPMPSSRSASARRRTSCETSAHVSERRSPSSGTHTAASRSGVSDAHRWTHAFAMLSRAPTNHVVHSMPRVSSSTASQSRANGIPRSLTTARQNRSGSSIDTRCSSSYSEQPSDRASRAMFAEASCSSLGVHVKPDDMSDDLRRAADHPVRSRAEGRFTRP